MGGCATAFDAAGILWQNRGCGVFWIRWVWLGIGWMAVGLAIIGAILPIMPTVPFLIVAVWAFARSSPRLRDRILNDPRFGPMLRDWMDYGAIPPFTKGLAVVAMAGGCVSSYVIGMPYWFIAAQAGICTLISAYILTRPNPPRH